MTASARRCLVLFLALLLAASLVSPVLGNAKKGVSEEGPEDCDKATVSDIPPPAAPGDGAHLPQNLVGAVVQCLGWCPS